MRERASGANLLHELFQEQALMCVLKFACRNMTCLQLANQSGLFFYFPYPNRRVLRVYWLRYLPGGVFLERVSRAIFFVCTGL